MYKSETKSFDVKINLEWRNCFFPIHVLAEVANTTDTT